MAQDKYQVLVAGGGPGGCAAAVAAGRLGMRVLLIERYGFLGGMATAGLVNPFMPYTIEGKPIIEGVFGEILEQLSARGGLHQNAVTFDEEVLKVVLDDLVTGAGCDLLLHAWLADVQVEDGRVEAVEVETKSGRLTFEADIFIDGTGDGDLATRAGATVEHGRAEDGLAQPMTLCFRVGGVVTERMPDRGEINRLYREAQARGEVDCPRDNVLFFPSVHPGFIHFNTTRVIKRKAVDAGDVTAAELEARRQMHQIVAFLRKQVAGFESAYLSHSAAQIGVRESRRIMGDYVLTEEDVLSARKFDDGICRGNYPLDIHNPAGSGTVIKRLAPGTSYEIPYRSLLPRGLENVLVASRCISATHEAHGSLRIMPIVIAIGEAAGTAAGICTKEGVAPRQLDPEALREQLRRQGANLRREEQAPASAARPHSRDPRKES